MSDTEDVQLPIPSRKNGSSNVGANDNIRGGGGAGGSSFFLGFGSSRKLGDGETRGRQRIGSRRPKLPSNGSKGRFGIDGSTTESTRGESVNGGGTKACTACGFQFTWRQRRHHCRACRKVKMADCFSNSLLIDLKNSINRGNYSSTTVNIFMELMRYSESLEAQNLNL